MRLVEPRGSSALLTLGHHGQPPQCCSRVKVLTVGTRPGGCRWEVFFASARTVVLHFPADTAPPRSVVVTPLATDYVAGRFVLIPTCARGFASA